MRFGKRKDRKKEAGDFLEQADQLARSHFYREALELYKNEWECNRSDRQALFGISACLYRLGDFQSALRHVNALLEMDGDNPKAARLQAAIRQKTTSDQRKQCLLDDSDELCGDDL